jgi:hypothetical protein
MTLSQMVHYGTLPSNRALWHTYSVLVLTTLVVIQSLHTNTRLYVCLLESCSAPFGILVQIAPRAPRKYQSQMVFLHGARLVQLHY